jgi:hypothetical protein
MLTKETVTDKIEVLEDGTVQVREATYILEDGVRRFGPTYRRIVMQPGESTSGKAARIAAVAAAVWTPEVVADFETKQAEQHIDITEEVKPRA